MEFAMEATLPGMPETVWPVLLDVARVSRCIPGCESVEELAPMDSYKALFKQKVGPFRVEIPADIRVEEVREAALVRIHADGRCRITRTTLGIDIAVALAVTEAGGSRLAVTSTLQMRGQLARLGQAVIRKRASQNFAEFEERLLAELGAA